MAQVLAQALRPVTAASHNRGYTRDTVKVLITDSRYPDMDIEQEILHPAGFEVMRAQCLTPAEVIEAGQGAHALLVQYAPITREVMRALPGVSIICRYGVGVDSIDLEAARERGVWVANVPDYGVIEVATHALAMALALLRHLPFYDRAVREGAWHYLDTGTLQRPSALTLGIVGLGRIGGALASLARPCFRAIVASDPYLAAEAWPPGVKRVALDDLFAASHVVSLHAPLTAETAGLVDRKRLALLPERAYLVNTARGAVVNLDDLLESLDSGRLAGAALDVLPEEPPPSGHRIRRHPRVILSPHAAFYSTAAEHDLRAKAARNIAAWAQGGRPPYVVVEGKTEGA